MTWQRGDDGGREVLLRHVGQGHWLYREHVPHHQVALLALPWHPRHVSGWLVVAGGWLMVAGGWLMVPGRELRFTSCYNS